MFYYIRHRHMDTGQNVHVDVPLSYTGDLVPYYTQHKHTDGPQHTCGDVHSKEPVQKKKNLSKG
jgi:hypothetical protein